RHSRERGRRTEVLLLDLWNRRRRRRPHDDRSSASRRARPATRRRLLAARIGSARHVLKETAARGLRWIRARGSRALIAIVPLTPRKDVTSRSARALVAFDASITKERMKPADRAPR